MCGAVMCQSGQACCSGSCLSTLGDPNNCGGCGVSCPTSRADACVGGHCKCGSNDECPSNQSCCGGSCIDTSGNDDANCGSCGHACGTNQRCSSGSCVSTLCNGQPCDFLCCGGNTCADISRDPNNCGQCDHVCNTANGETCMPQGAGLGMCVVICGGTMCQTGQACCGGACTDVTLDDFNCGACGHLCDQNTSLCLNGCCADFNTLMCPPGSDGGIPIPDGGFPFPDGFPFPFPDAGVGPPDAPVRD